MSSWKRVVIKCDKCGTETAARKTYADAFWLANDEGWQLTVDGPDLCPGCADPPPASKMRIAIIEPDRGEKPVY